MTAQSALKILNIMYVHEQKLWLPRHNIMCKLQVDENIWYKRKCGEQIIHNSTVQMKRIVSNIPRVQVLTEDMMFMCLLSQMSLPL